MTYIPYTPQKYNRQKRGEPITGPPLIHSSNKFD